jgi:hypothetical protein
MRDTVDRTDEIKAADPKRRALVAIFEQWWADHGDTLLKAQDLDFEVIKLIPNATTRDGVISRQRVAGFLAMNVHARVGGYALTKVPLTKKVAGYKLTHQTGCWIISLVKCCAKWATERRSKRSMTT